MNFHCFNEVLFLLLIFSKESIVLGKNEFYEFRAIVFTNGSQPPLISTNITYRDVVNKITNILNDFGTDLAQDLRSESSHRRISVVYPSGNDITEGENIIKDVYEEPSVETDRWSVYWDSSQNNWYFYDKKRNISTWSKPEELWHIQLSHPKPGLGSLPEYLPRPRLPPPRHYQKYQLFNRRMDVMNSQNDNILLKDNYLLERTDDTGAEDDGFLWTIWKKSFGTIFEKEDRKKRNSRTNFDRLASPVFDSLGKMATRSLVNYLTNEVNKYFDFKKEEFD